MIRARVLLQSLVDVLPKLPRIDVAFWNVKLFSWERHIDKKNMYQRYISTLLWGRGFPKVLNLQRKQPQQFLASNMVVAPEHGGYC